MFELKKIKENDRYKNFTFLESPVPFNKLFAGKDYDVVQLHDMTPVSDDDIVGFCGQCEWKDDNLTPLDHDSYTKKMDVFGYEEFPVVDENGNVLKGVDILVEEW